MAVSYRAAWSLPGLDLHQLVDTSLRENNLVSHSLLSLVSRYLGTPGFRFNSLRLEQSSVLLNCR